MVNKEKFSQRHPFLFGFFLIITAVVLIIGAMVVFTFWRAEGMKFAFGGPQLAVVKIEGTITSSVKVNRWIEKIDKNEDIKGVLVRINSPGGVVAPSQEIFQTLNRLSKSKPVVVSMGSIATSGAYYVACAADSIIANPGSITGSIGVKAQVPNIQRLMDKIGVDYQTITSGKFKDTGSPTQPLSTEGRKYLQNMVDDLFEQFVEDVAQGRGMEVKKVRELANGKAYTGRQALQFGLVDKLGGMESAKDHLRKLCKMKAPVSWVVGPEEEFSLISWLLGGLTERIKKKINTQHWQFIY